MIKKLLVAILICILVFLLPQLASGTVDTDKCKDCHEAVKPIPLSSITKDCMICHGNHDSGEPQSRAPKDVHRIHTSTKERSAQRCGTTCHRAPVECSNCHNYHEIGTIRDTISDINNKSQNKTVTTVIDINVTNCNTCHGKLPQPTGHNNFRNALSESKHKWMNCRTCHINTENEFKLHFKDLYATSINDSMNLCKICHSLQYGELKDNNHGISNKTCVDCHNPHTTRLSGKIQLTSKEPPANLSNTFNKKFDSTKKWLFTKIPILNNPTILLIILIIVALTVSEYILSRHEEGTKIAYNMVKVQANEDTLKTLEIKLKNKNINIINNELEKDGINILGMTMAKEEMKEKGTLLDIYKYVVFIDKGKQIEIDDESLVNKISSISDIKNDIQSIKITDKYEL